MDVQTKTGSSLQDKLRRERLKNPAVFIKNTCLLFLQTIYSQRPKGDLRYDENDTRTEILISDSYPDTEAKETIPAIVSMRGPLSWGHLGGTGMVRRETGTDKKDYLDLISGSISFIILSKNELETERIAAQVFSAFRHFQDPLKASGFHSIRTAEMSSSALIEQAGFDKLYSAQVSVMVTFPDSWSIAPDHAIKIRRMMLGEVHTNG